MALYYSHSHLGQSKDLGKFRTSRKPGVQQDKQLTYEGYRMELLSVRSTSTVGGMRYHVSIFHRSNLRVGYLRDFSSASQAFAAARRWIEEREMTQRNRRARSQ